MTNVSLTTGANTRLDAGLVILRVVVGTIFIAHGAQKLFVFGPTGVAEAFAKIGVPMAGLVGPAVTFLEFLGGIALVAGVATSVVALGLAMDMLGAMAFVHLKAGFFLPGGVEFVLALFGGALTLALTGAGEFSVDRLLARRRRWESGARRMGSAAERG